MGTCLEFYLKTAPGERVETALTLPEQQSAVITGRVTRHEGNPASGAVVLVLEGESLQPVCHCITDAQGLFALGPLSGGLYHIHVYDGAAPVRIVNIQL